MQLQGPSTQRSIRTIYLTLDVPWQHACDRASAAASRCAPCAIATELGAAATPTLPDPSLEAEPVRYPPRFQRAFDWLPRPGPTSSDVHAAPSSILMGQSPAVNGIVLLAPQTPPAAAPGVLAPRAGRAPRHNTTHRPTACAEPLVPHMRLTRREARAAAAHLVALPILTCRHRPYSTRSRSSTPYRYAVGIPTVLSIPYLE